LGAPFESLKRGNILDFIAYGFHCCRVEELAPEVSLTWHVADKHTACYSTLSGLRTAWGACWQVGRAYCEEPVGEGGGRAPQVRERLDAYVRRVEETWGVRFEEGRTPGLRFMAHLWEDLNFLWKPLAVRPAPRPPRPAERAPLHAVGAGGKGASGLRAAALGAPDGGLGRAASAAGAPGGRGHGPGDVRAAAGAWLPQAPQAGARAAPGGGAACARAVAQPGAGMERAGACTDLCKQTDTVE